MMVTNAKPTRNADLRHAQSIGRQRQAAQKAAADASPENLTQFPAVASAEAPATETQVDAPRPSWRDHEPAIVHSIKWGSVQDPCSCYFDHERTHVINRIML